MAARADQGHRDADGAKSVAIQAGEPLTGDLDMESAGEVVLPQVITRDVGDAGAVADDVDDPAFDRAVLCCSISQILAE